MRLLSRKWVVPFGLLIILVMAVAACNGQGDKPFRIGVMESLTGPGETYGNVAVQAKQMAVDEINEAGGIDGRMIELVVRRFEMQRAGRDYRLQQAHRRRRYQDHPGDIVQRRDAWRGAPG